MAIKKSKSKSKSPRPTNPSLYARVKAEAKRKFKVYPSAYANAWLVRTYKKAWWRLRIMSLKEWFGKGSKGDWVDIGAPKKKGKYQACGRKSATKSKRAYPKCVPRAKAATMTKGQIKSAVKKKKKCR